VLLVGDGVVGGTGDERYEDEVDKEPAHGEPCSKLRSDG
jgi:hypothetical protein